MSHLKHKKTPCLTVSSGGFCRGVSAAVFRVKEIFFPVLLLLASASCSDKSMERDVLTAFERHSYAVHSRREILDALRSGPAGLKVLDKRLEFLEVKKELREMPGGGLSSGLLLGERGGALYIVKVFRGSAGVAAGLQEGDRILEVDGLNSGAGAAAKRIRSAVRFRVKVARLMPGDRWVSATADVQKKYLIFPFIFGLYDPLTRTAFVRIAIFSQGAGAAVSRGLAALARMGAEKVVFDLRDTAGGVPDEAAALLADFAPGPGPVFEIRSRHPGYCKLFQAPGRGRFAPLKTRVLVNSRTAMAAEIFAASLRELNGAAVIGEETMGEVSLTRIFKAGRNGRGMQLTVARLFPPSGAELEGKGLEPDFKTGLDIEEAEAVRAEWSAAGETALLNDPAWRKALAAN
jgi:carboxyl-terminal processing protease